jgi:mutator protein MutT
MTPSIPDPRPRIAVVAAVVERDDAFLVTRRIGGTHLEGYWEFPGGKRQEGESDTEALMRELREELAVDVIVGDLVLFVSHAYEDRELALNFYRCELRGEPRPQLGQEMRWARGDELRTLQVPPADEELIALLTGGG